MYSLFLSYFPFSFEDLFLHNIELLNSNKKHFLFEQHTHKEKKRKERKNKEEMRERIKIIYIYIKYTMEAWLPRTTTVKLR